ncbi:transcriptional regulator NrdR [Carboxydothermus pertinax]|uniref:Transcriptional repressor NrdR n=1 Tax=Carboxydothermus pertinax TaxID=870242 RepID=A0A1L8CSA1_9THEO|nr:transcriptional regulator NrdR [Carboxydothermus pertinax]GAV21792.1 NrdR family transcriptional regulator [Carboxydothermus pertinax]
MRCPFCGSENTRVVDTRAAEDGFAIKRRRECENCSKRFTTYERLDDRPLIVVKKDGTKQLFDKHKIYTGMLKACEKRPIAEDRLLEIAEEIERELKNRMEQEVTSLEIGEMVMNRLKKLDEVAYVRFASVYRQFKDVNSFLEELKKLLNGGEDK